MASKAIGALSSLVGSALNSSNTVNAQIDPTLLKFLQNQGTLAARFQASESGVPFGGSTNAAGRAGFNQYGALLSANQTANQIAAVQQQASNIGNQLSTASAGQAGSAAGTAAGSGLSTDSTSNVGTS
jgi:hypothetical protein